MDTLRTHAPTSAVNHLLVAGAILAGLFLAPGPAEAQQGRQAPPFEAVDTDGDGFVSEAELDAFRADRMARAAAAGRPMARAGGAPAFDDIDQDGDGRLSPQEMEAIHPSGAASGRGAMGAGQARNPGAGQGKGRGSGRAAASGPGRAGAGQRMATFEEIDLDGDGCISREELAEHHRGRGEGGA